MSSATLPFPDIRLIVFDIAGTTVDDGDAVNRCLREALAAFDVVVTRDAVNRVMGLPKPEAIRHLTAGTAMQAETAAIHALFVERMRGFYETASPEELREYPGTQDTFHRLRASGIRVALDTGFDRPTARTVIDRMGWERAGLLDATVTSDEVERGRPHPDMIRHLMARLDISDTAQVAKVGDTPADLEEGLNSGCGLVLGVTSGTHTREQLASFLSRPCVRLLDSVRLLPDLLQLP